jgi:hypothetical protein
VPPEERHWPPELMVLERAASVESPRPLVVATPQHFQE